jgi:LysM domain/Lamin Tail Domain
MTRQQATVLIIVNAAVSALISLIVVAAGLALFAPPVVERVIVDGTARPLGTPVPTRRTTAVNYTIKAGDSLSMIAANFGISTSALMQANGLTNPNLLTVGQVIVIPPPDLTSSASVVATPATAVPPVAPILKISAILRSASASSVGEMVIIQNVGARINMKGWTLQDLRSNIYVFPDFVLESNAGVRVHTDAGLDSATDLFWNRSAAVWESNDTATLKDRGGVVIDSYTIRK